MHRAVPESSEHLHTISIVPDGCRDSPPWFSDATNLPQGFDGIRDEIEHQQRETGVKARIGKTQLLCIAGLEPHPIWKWILTLGIFYVFFGWVDSTHMSPRFPFRQGEGQCSCT